MCERKRRRKIQTGKPQTDKDTTSAKKGITIGKERLVGGKEEEKGVGKGKEGNI